MNPSNTICVSQEGPANALALNKDCSQVVIAGRNVFKVFSIGEDEFTEVCNLRVGKNLNLNFSSIDVAWSTFEENTLATAATNGAVVVWNLGRSGRSKQEHVFSDHKRTVNKPKDVHCWTNASYKGLHNDQYCAARIQAPPAILTSSSVHLVGGDCSPTFICDHSERRFQSSFIMCTAKVSFHLTEPSLLVSGSQDGMMKCFDLRMKEVARTFISNTESIRDVQFSPLSSHTFAAVSENGSAQLWDVRRHERPLAQFTAHSGPVFACDWHPMAPWLATASRDKTIKVWDIHAAKPTLEYTIYTIASVGNVKWRPQKKYQVSSCALVLDCAVHVWDVRRPHLPLATFAEHRDVTTALRWQSSSAFLACSRDCGLYRHRWSEAAHPLLWANPHAVALSPSCLLASAVPQRPLPPPTTTSTARDAGNTHRPGLGRKQPTAGSLTPSAQASLERAFPSGAASCLARYGPAKTTADPVLGCAVEYRLHGLPPHLLAEHNANVATKYQRHMVCHVWSVVRLWCGASCPRNSPPPAPLAPPPPPPSPPPPPEPTLEPDEWAETCFHNSGVLGKPTHSIYIPPARRANIGEDDLGWVSAASAHYVDLEAADWALPEEAFPLRSAPLPPLTAAATHPSHPGLQLTDYVDGPSHLNAATTAVPAAPPSPPSSPSSSHTASHSQPSYGHQTSMSQGECPPPLSVSPPPPAGRRRAPPAALLAAALRLHADLGDVQTAAIVLLALHERRGEVLAFIEESLQEQWLLGYIELLQRHQLWNQATEVIRLSWVCSVWSLSQQSTAVSLACGRCGRRVRGGRGCDRCGGGGGARCGVCRQTVLGLYAWCQGCAHGGHLHHLQAWLRTHQLCPAGCGHRCQLP